MAQRAPSTTKFSQASSPFLAEEDDFLLQLAAAGHCDARRMHAEVAKRFPFDHFIRSLAPADLEARALLLERPPESDTPPPPPPPPPSSSLEPQLASTLAGSTIDPMYHTMICNAIVESGTMGMSTLVDKLIQSVVPAGVISKRQLMKEITVLAVKEKRPGDRAARWYLR